MTDCAIENGKNQLSLNIHTNTYAHMCKEESSPEEKDLRKKKLFLNCLCKLMRQNERENEIRCENE